MIDALLRMANAILPMYILMGIGFAAQKYNVMEKSAYRGIHGIVMRQHMRVRVIAWRMPVTSRNVSSVRVHGAVFARSGVVSWFSAG